MSVELLTDSSGVTLLFDSVTGMPIPTPTFETAEEADDFLRYVEEMAPVDIRTLRIGTLLGLRRLWDEYREQVPDESG